MSQVPSRSYNWNRVRASWTALADNMGYVCAITQGNGLLL
jgi:hypothetical protein